MDISLTTNLTSNASCSQNNQQPDRNIDDNVKNNSTQSKKYPCTFEGCTSILTRKETLDNHMLVHYNQQKYPCGTCGKKLNTERSLRNHETTHGDKIFTCYICDRSFTCIKYFKSHKRTKLHNRNIKNIPIDHSPYKPAPCITEDKSRSVGIVTKVHSRLNHETQNVYQDNNKPDPLKLPDNKMACVEQDIDDDTMLYIEQIIQKTNFLSYIEEQFDENILFDIKQNSDEEDI
jgi:ribosomal protein L37AE/L43A